MYFSLEHLWGDVALKRQFDKKKAFFFVLQRAAAREADKAAQRGGERNRDEDWAQEGKYKQWKERFSSRWRVKKTNEKSEQPEKEWWQVEVRSIDTLKQRVFLSLHWDVWLGILMEAQPLRWRCENRENVVRRGQGKAVDRQKNIHRRMEKEANTCKQGKLIRTWATGWPQRCVTEQQFEVKGLWHIGGLAEREKSKVRHSLTFDKWKFDILTNRKMSFQPTRWGIWEEAWDPVAGVEGKTPHWSELIWGWHGGCTVWIQAEVMSLY